MVWHSDALERKDGAMTTTRKMLCLVALASLFSFTAQDAKKAWYPYGTETVVVADRLQMPMTVLPRRGIIGRRIGATIG
jgi:hypothetical protein